MNKIKKIELLKENNNFKYFDFLNKDIFSF
jgi:hypothetical protein